jgi:uncharacterized protein
MSRSKKCRCINYSPNSSYFKPKGTPLIPLEDVFPSLDELEAIRLVDYQGFYHEKAAEQMNISRATFGCILDSARHKVADAITNGKALQIGAVK